MPAEFAVPDVDTLTNHDIERLPIVYQRSRRSPIDRQQIDYLYPGRYTVLLVSADHMSRHASETDPLLHPRYASQVIEVRSGEVAELSLDLR